MKGRCIEFHAHVMSSLNSHFIYEVVFPNVFRCIFTFLSPNLFIFRTEWKRIKDWSIVSASVGRWLAFSNFGGGGEGFDPTAMNYKKFFVPLKFAEILCTMIYIWLLTYVTIKFLEIYAQKCSGYSFKVKFWQRVCISSVCIPSVNYFVPIWIELN